MIAIFNTRCGCQRVISMPGPALPRYRVPLAPTQKEIADILVAAPDEPFVVKEREFTLIEYDPEQQVAHYAEA